MMDLKFAALGAIATVGGGAFLIGAPERGEYYEMSRAEVASRLATAPLPESLSSEMRGGQLSITRRKLGESRVVWEFAALGQEIGELTAVLEPADSGTRVTVEFDLADTSLGNAARADLGGSRELVEAGLRLGMLEHIDATLEKRSFDEKKFARDLAAYAVKNPAAIKHHAERMKQLESDEGRDPAVASALEEQIRADAQWHGDGSPYESSGSESDWGN